TDSAGAHSARAASQPFVPRPEAAAPFGLVRHGSVPDQERVEAAAPQPGLAHQQVQAKRRDIVGDRLERRILVLMQDLHVAAAGVAGLGLDRAGAAVDLLIAHALGGTPGRALDAYVVP